MTGWWPMSSDATETINQTIAALLPGFRSAKRRVLLTLLGVALIPVVLFILFPPVKDQFLYPLAVLGITAIPLVLFPSQIRRAHERALMPVLARAVGLTHQKGEAGLHTVFKGLANAQQFSADDVLSGQIGTRTFHCAEVRSSFVGLFLAFPVTPDLPDFRLIVALHTHVPFQDPAFDSIRRYDGPFYVLSPAGVGHPDQEALGGYLQCLMALGDLIPPFGRLEEAVATGGVLKLALACPGDFFRLSGLFPGEDQLTLDLKAAMTELGLPFRLAEALIEAEARYMATKGPSNEQ
jgi:hypothetical protein